MALLEVEQVSVVFGGLAALTDVTMAVEAGSVRSVIGPNGAGKTTLFNAITGYEQPRQGVVRLDGQSINHLSAHQRARIGLRRTFQNGGMFGDMTVLENVMVGADRLARSSIAGVVFGLPRARAMERRAVADARDMLARAGLDRVEQTRVRDLSFGQQRMVEITRALISQPRVLLLDEPAVGLSQTERDALVVTLRDLAGQGMAVLLVEHVIDLVMAVSDRVTVLNFGRVLAEGTPEEMRGNQAVLEAYLGSA